MNYSIIRYIIGWVMVMEAVLLLLPAVVSLIYQEKSFWAFLSVAVLCGIAGGLSVLRKPKSKVFYSREGFVTVALCWIVLSLVGTLPFMISGDIPVFIDALFETVSGFTTTGASVLADVEALSRGAAFWRSFTHWIGGMGVLVFVIAILPLAGGYNIHLLKAESPGHNVSKLVPKVRTTALILYSIYILMTGVEIVILLISGMPWFDAFTLSFGTAGTGGFGILNDSVASYTAFQQWTITIFMILFGINFNFYFCLLIRKPLQGFKMEELRYYFGFIIGAIILIAFNIRNLCSGWEETFRHASFQVGSVITTTGYSTTDFDLWPQFSKCILFLLMFIGACSGSTGGGVKVSRVVIALKTVKKEMNSLIHSRSVKRLQFDGHTIEHEVIRSVHVFFVTYLVIFGLSFLAVSLDNFSFETTGSAVMATLNNIGPGFDGVGPTQNFGDFSVLSKCVMIFDMLAGRLELFPLLMLFRPTVWKKF